MEEFYVVYDVETGLPVFFGKGGPGDAQVQKGHLAAGQDVLVVPRQASPLLGGSFDLDIVKASYAASVDADADKVRSMFITNTPGQMATYLEKEAEARRIIAGDTAASVFLSAEAAALGIDLVDLAQEVIAQADQWRPIGAAIEAKRRCAKVALAAAGDLSAIAQAIQIDWRALTAPPALS